MTETAHNFTRKRDAKRIKKQFLQVLEYMVFCYHYLKKDNEENQLPYSKNDCSTNTAFTFEDWLKIRFVEDYLQEFKNHFNCPDIKEIHFQYETQKTYIDPSGKQRIDKIDVIISNLGLQEYWSGVREEDRYFAFECKRLHNTANNANYISDIKKFAERQYKVRSPFEGMIGFVEKSSISIETIILDINQRLRDHDAIKTLQELTSIEPAAPGNDFKYCRLSKHSKSFEQRITFGVYHLFFDYSNLIVD